MALKEAIAKNVRRLRTAQGFTQQRLAELSGIDVRSVNRLEAAAQNVTIEVVERVANALCVPVAHVISDAAESHSPELIEELKHLFDHADTLNEKIQRIRGLISQGRASGR